MGNNNNHVKEPAEEMIDKLKDAKEHGDKYKMKDIIDSFHPPFASYYDTEVKRQRTEAFKYAIKLNDFAVVEMLYDYWSGDWHWVGHDINKIKTLGQLLKDARHSCKVQYQQLLMDIKSLIKFNDFQQELYCKISNFSNRTESVSSSMLVEVLRLYDKYSDLEKVRIRQVEDELERSLKAVLNDNNSEVMKAQAYIRYEVYFRKLDVNVALLIFENLFIIRKYLNKQFRNPQRTPQEVKHDVDSYKDIECVIYHFMYYTCEGWSLYLPRNRVITTETDLGTDKGKTIQLIYTFDAHKSFYALLLFNERMNFTKSLNKLQTILEKYVNIVVMDQNSKQINNILDENYPTPTYMSDYYSLSKIVYYIKALENTKHSNILMIERVLQVTGEMIKSSQDTKHLLESTKSLLQIGIPAETITFLQKIRDYLSKADKGQINARIDIANTFPNIFDEVKEDFKMLKEPFQSVLDIYKNLLDKPVLEKGLQILNEQIENLPDEASQHLDLFVHGFKKFGNTRPNFLDLELSAYTGLPSHLVKEIIPLLEIRDDIITKINKVKRNINEKIVSILPTYILNIREMLRLISENQSYVNEINAQLKPHNIEMPVIPTSSDIDNTENKLKSMKKRNNSIDIDTPLEALRKIKNFSQHCKVINKMLSFFLNNGELFAPEAPEHILPDDFDMSTVTNKITELENTCTHVPAPANSVFFSFGGIETLHKIFEQKQPVNSKAELMSCLIGRVDLLRNKLQHVQYISLRSNVPSEQLLRRYKDDLKFRFELEMILADIANILKHCKIYTLMNKSFKLLREINLRNVLHHGNPILEVIGDIFDAYDLSTGLLSLAIMFVKDGESLKALFELFKVNVDHKIIEDGKVNEMNDEQKEYYNQFQRSPNWKTYVKLVEPPSMKRRTSCTSAQAHVGEE